jgi:Zn ribbon nucleic-acid-binding protein
MAETIIVIRTDEPLDEHYHSGLLEQVDLLAETEQLGDVRTTIDGRVVDSRWAEGDECPECESAIFDYRNVEDRRVASSGGVATMKGMEKHHAVVRVACVSCGHIVRSSPAVDLATTEGVPITEADFEADIEEDSA